MLFLFPAFDLTVHSPDGMPAGLYCIPWQKSSDDWMLIVGCPEMKTGEYLMPYDRALHRFSFGDADVPTLLRFAEKRINEKVGELNQI